LSVLGFGESTVSEFEDGTGEEVERTGGGRVCPVGWRGKKSGKDRGREANELATKCPLPW
jgi:hypothetical protein